VDPSITGSLARSSGPKACHDPFQPAPWYTNTWEDGWPTGAPRPPSWNMSRPLLAEHHPTISCRPAFGPQTAACIDRDFKNRWRTLLSVDDLIAATVSLVDDELGLANSTYYLYSSDQCAPAPPWLLLRRSSLSRAGWLIVLGWRRQWLLAGGAQSQLGQAKRVRCVRRGGRVDSSGSDLAWLSCLRPVRQSPWVDRHAAARC
jgi:hypothetical protein